MAHDRIDPSEQIPRSGPPRPTSPARPAAADATPRRRRLPATTLEDADDADRVEQHTPVPGGDEDDYPHDPTAVGWS